MGTGISPKSKEGCRVTAKEGKILFRVMKNCYGYPLKVYTTIKRLILSKTT